MSLVHQRRQTMVRRAVGGALATDVVVSLLIGALIASTIGWVVFFIGLVVTGFIYYNMRQVMRTRV